MDKKHNLKPIARLRLPIRYDYYLHCAKTWETIFTGLLRNNVAIVYDLCCGWSPKIELALTGTGFRGRLYAIDRSEQVLAVHRQFSSILVPQFRITYRICDILESPNLQIPKADLIVGNHILDDLILNYYCKTKHSNVDHLFSHPDRLKPVWEEIMKHPLYAETTFRQTARFILKHIAVHGRVMLTHYPGYQELLYGYPKDMNAYRVLLAHFKKILLASGKYTDRSIKASTIIKKMGDPYFSSDSMLLVEAI